MRSAALPVQRVEKKEPLAHFLTQICAIIGGTVSIFGIVDGMFFATTTSVKRAMK